MRNKDLKHRILEISYKHKLSHIGSCMTAVDIISDIYNKKKDDEKFILSSGHAGLALYVVLEKHTGVDAEQLLLKHGIHPNRDDEEGIYCSTGSLGHGLGIAVGMACSDRSKKVYCVISDGESAEGSIWEALLFCEKMNVDNLHVKVNINGYGAYDPSNVDQLKRMFKQFRCPHIEVVLTNPGFPMLHGLSAHYMTMSEEQYKYSIHHLYA